MRSTKQSKACGACTSGKRRCDKAQPMCGRCDEKGIECRYPPTKRRKNQLHAIRGHGLNESSVDGTPRTSGLANPEGQTPDDLLFDLDHWIDPVVTWNDLLPSQPPLDYINADASKELIHPDTAGPSTNTAPLTSSWFRHPGSWTISHTPSTIPCFSSAVFSDYSRNLEAWLCQWVANGHNPFIHRQLYADSGLPQPMRDAYASITVHSSKTRHNEAMVYQIMEANAATLLDSHCGVGTFLDTRQHLARTQALLIHLALSLFSPSIGARAQAERNIPTFMAWAEQLWEAASQDPDLSDNPRVRDSESKLQEDAVADAMFDGDPAPRLWRVWVLAESIRRTWVLGTMTMGVYLTQKQGWCECNGGAKFTMRSDIWAAESALRWSQAVRKQDPLFSMSLECGGLFANTKAAAVDEFARHLLTVMYGLERVESWAARTAGEEGMVKLVC
ncbi:hypothetical protein EDB81DRAFT_814263 [Dactylonectria macrodidyma]|uniref:Zn(2)-C6 fungal-type domain-containing protein n=1 Tax=Dactylonectria macrodidyma TaxID=307937 RepID=A0A9P9DK59_9HYPO|nr:hypothetical protein EDB81DRAFT_814263 [Dactylonectria macrodidyma]